MYVSTGCARDISVYTCPDDICCKLNFFNQSETFLLCFLSSGTSFRIFIPTITSTSLQPYKFLANGILKLPIFLFLVGRLGTCNIGMFKRQLSLIILLMHFAILILRKKQNGMICSLAKIGLLASLPREKLLDRMARFCRR